jgi:hypothetical protein
VICVTIFLAILPFLLMFPPIGNNLAWRNYWFGQVSTLLMINVMLGAFALIAAIRVHPQRR